MPRRLTDEERALRLITEKQWQTKVQQLMTGYGWLWYHSPDNRPVRGNVQRIRPGFPDLIAVRGVRMIAAELKKETGVVSEAQHDWLNAMERAGLEVFVWRPSDLKEVIEVLKPNW